VSVFSIILSVCIRFVSCLLFRVDIVCVVMDWWVVSMLRVVCLFVCVRVSNVV